MALLRTTEIGHPNDGPMARHHLSDHRGGTTVAHDVYHHLIVLEYPVPVGASVDTHRGLIGSDDPRAAQPGEDGCDLGVETRLVPLQHPVPRPLAHFPTLTLLEQ